MISTSSPSLFTADRSERCLHGSRDPPDVVVRQRLEELRDNLCCSVTQLVREGEESHLKRYGFQGFTNVAILWNREQYGSSPVVLLTLQPPPLGNSPVFFLMICSKEF